MKPEGYTMTSIRIVFCAVLIMLFTGDSSASEKHQEHIDIFTTEKGEKGYAMSRFRALVKIPVYVHHVDAIENFEQRLTEHITTKDKNKAIEQARNSLNGNGFAKERAKLKNGVMSFEKAIRLNITKVPAVVFNDEQIVYGERPIRALQIYNRKRAQ